MATIYLILGVAGSTFLILQFLFSLLGFDHHDFPADSVDVDSGDMDHGGDVHDAHGHGEAHHNDASTFFKMLSVRAIVAAITFFGWSGLAAHNGGLNTALSLLIACGGGLVAMYVVAWMMRALYSLQAAGNVEIDHAIGARGTVYLTIPARKSGTGKVQVNVRERTMEYEAVTADEALPTGEPVIVVGVVGEDRVEVRPIPRMEVVE